MFNKEIYGTSSSGKVDYLGHPKKKVDYLGHYMNYDMFNF